MAAASLFIKGKTSEQGVSWGSSQPACPRQCPLQSGPAKPEHWASPGRVRAAVWQELVLQFPWASLSHSNPSFCFNWWSSVPSKPVSPLPIPKASWLSNFLFCFSTARTSSLLSSSQKFLPLFSSTSGFFGFSWLCHQTVVFVLWYVLFCTVFAGKPHVAKICMKQVLNMLRKHLEESRLRWLKSVCRGRSLPAVGWQEGQGKKLGECLELLYFWGMTWESVLFIKYTFLCCLSEFLIFTDYEILPFSAFLCVYSSETRNSLSVSTMFRKLHFPFPQLIQKFLVSWKRSLFPSDGCYQKS